MNKKNISIAVNGRTFTLTSTGISNYLLNAVNSLAKKGCSLTIYANTPIKDDIIERLDSNIKIVTNTISPFFLYFHIVLPLILLFKRHDYFWSPTPSLPFLLSKKKIITVHDFVYPDFKETMSWKNRIKNSLYHNLAIRYSDIVWCVSDYTKQRFQELFPKYKHPVFVGSSIDTSTFKKIEVSVSERDKLLDEVGITNPFILFVGSLEPRKNLQFLLKLSPVLYNKYGFVSLIVGAKGWKNSDLKSDISRLTEAGYVKFAGYVSTEDLVRLYNLASCFVSTSLNEGFGLPQLEALSCGCKVVTASNSAMKEVVSDYGTLVDGWDQKVWIDAILRTIAHDTIVSYDKEKYNWDIISEDFLKLIV
ncbi:MAG: glycosyltransferase family 4 protein [Paludibacteraceae bacterium]|nr:glycosyltransferase family 4 protein [Paludibacteraceae bacterium]